MTLPRQSRLLSGSSSSVSSSGSSWVPPRSSGLVSYVANRRDRESRTYQPVKVTTSGGMTVVEEYGVRDINTRLSTPYRKSLKTYDSNGNLVREDTWYLESKGNGQKIVKGDSYTYSPSSVTYTSASAHAELDDQASANRSPGVPQVRSSFAASRAGQAYSGVSGGVSYSVSEPYGQYRNGVKAQSNSYDLVTIDGRSMPVDSALASHIQGGGFVQLGSPQNGLSPSASRPDYSMFAPLTGSSVERAFGINQPSSRVVSASSEPYGLFKEGSLSRTTVVENVSPSGSMLLFGDPGYTSYSFETKKTIPSKYTTAEGGASSFITNSRAYKGSFLQGAISTSDRSVTFLDTAVASTPDSKRGLKSFYRVSAGSAGILNAMVSAPVRNPIGTAASFGFGAAVGGAGQALKPFGRALNSRVGRGVGVGLGGLYAGGVALSAESAPSPGEKGRAYGRGIADAYSFMGGAKVGAWVANGFSSGQLVESVRMTSRTQERRVGWVDRKPRNTGSQRSPMNPRSYVVTGKQTVGFAKQGKDVNIVNFEKQQVPFSKQPKGYTGELVVTRYVETSVVPRPTGVRVSKLGDNYVLETRLARFGDGRSNLSKARNTGGSQSLTDVRRANKILNNMPLQVTFKDRIGLKPYAAPRGVSGVVRPSGAEQLSFSVLQEAPKPLAPSRARLERATAAQTNLPVVGRGNFGGNARSVLTNPVTGKKSQFSFSTGDYYAESPLINNPLTPRGGFRAGMREKLFGNLQQLRFERMRSNPMNSRDVPYETFTKFSSSRRVVNRPFSTDTRLGLGLRGGVGASYGVSNLVGSRARIDINAGVSPASGVSSVSALDLGVSTSQVVATDQVTAQELAFGLNRPFSIGKSRKRVTEPVPRAFREPSPVKSPVDERPRVPVFRPRAPVPPPVITPPKYRPSKKNFVGSSSFSFGSLFKQKKGYTPSAFALVQDIKGSPSKRGVISGLGVRPITFKGFKL